MTINPPLTAIPSDFTTRKATNEDSKAIQELIFGVLKEYKLKPEPDSTDKDLFDIEKNYQYDFFGVIELGSKIVATFALSPLSDECAELRKMYATKKVRGKGLGKWMVKYIIQIAKENGFSEIELETASSLREAIILYEKMGFIEKQFENKTPRCDKAFTIKLR
jgi:putative acetyltransferase